MSQPIEIRPATGKLGILTPGMGAVATTFYAGVLSMRKGLSKPIGSLTQMGHIRLGKRTEDRQPLIKEFVPLAGLDDLVFGGWDPINDDAYTAATRCGVLDEKDLLPIKDEMSAIKPMTAVFDNRWVKKLEGTYRHYLADHAVWFELSLEVNAEAAAVGFVVAKPQIVWD